MEFPANIPKECVICHGRFSAKRHSAKYCSERCRKRSQRILEVPPPPAAVMKMGVTALPARKPDELGLLMVTRRELEAAGRLDTPMGQATMLLATLLDSGVQDTGSSIAALVREYKATIKAALDGVQRVQSPIERRRAERVARVG